jgi:hypothetical protein
LQLVTIEVSNHELAALWARTYRDSNLGRRLEAFRHTVTARVSPPFTALTPSRAD